MNILTFDATQSELLAVLNYIFKNKAPELQTGSSAQLNTNSRYHMSSASCSTQTLTTTCPQPAAQTSHSTLLTFPLRDGHTITQAISLWSVAEEVRDRYPTVDVGFEVDKVESEQFLLTVLRQSPVSIIPPVPYNHLSPTSYNPGNWQCR